MIAGRVFQALADPSRRRILRLLRSGPRSSGEIAEAFPHSWPTISRHLAILRDAGLASVEREGRIVRYELNTSVFQDLVQHFLDWTEPRSKHAKTPGRAGHVRVAHERRRVPQAT